MPSVVQPERPGLLLQRSEEQPQAHQVGLEGHERAQSHFLDRQVAAWSLRAGRAQPQVVRADAVR